MTLFSNQKLQPKNYAAIMALAARRQTYGGGAPINKSRRRRRPQIVGSGRGTALGVTYLVEGTAYASYEPNHPVWVCDEAYALKHFNLRTPFTISQQDYSNSP